MPVWVGVIIGYILDAVGLTSAVLGILNAIKAEVPTFAREHVQYSIAGQVNETNLAVNSSSSGLSVIYAEIVAIAVRQAIDSAAIAALGGPVTLPTIPPAGYGSTNPDDVAAAVWDTGIGGDGGEARNYLALAGAWSNWERLTWDSAPTGRWYTGANFAGDRYIGLVYEFPAFDPSYGDPALDFVTFIADQNPLATVSWYDGVGGHVLVHQPDSADISDFVTRLDNAGFLALRESLVASPVGLSPPIWPGVAGVTFGSSVALDRVVTLTEVMDGVVVTLTSVPPDKPKYVLGGLTATAHIGQIAFIADNGAAEYPQNLSFPSEIYVPLVLIGASAVVLRTVPGVTGTVQAWVRTI